MLKEKIIKLEDKYFSDEKIDIFTNINRYGKEFIRVNIYLKDKDITKTFNYSNKGYEQAVEFINEFEKM
ncbi:MAG: hypothetical protein HFJ20_03680 [Clostridia bacterium]|nr:hypothetical protein [Clostridia bacterium]